MLRGGWLDHGVGVGSTALQPGWMSLYDWCFQYLWCVPLSIDLSLCLSLSLFIRFPKAFIVGHSPHRTGKNIFLSSLSFLRIGAECKKLARRVGGKEGRRKVCMCRLRASIIVVSPFSLSSLSISLSHCL